MKKGSSLEVLIETIERLLLDDDTVKITRNAKLPDKITGRLREHDVLLQVARGHHTFKIGIECRDRSRKAGVSQVEEFAFKCRETGVDQGVIVSSTGFSKTAMVKAAHHGIRCLTLDEVDGFDWLVAPGIVVATRSISRVGCHIKLDTRRRDIKSYTLFIDDGRRVTEADLRATAQASLDHVKQTESPEKGSSTLIFLSTRNLYTL